MLIVDVRFVADELTPGLISGEYEVNEGTTVRELLALCESRCGVTLPEGNFKSIYPLINSKPAMLDSVITESGKIHVCRVVMGG